MSAGQPPSEPPIELAVLEIPCPYCGGPDKADLRPCEYCDETRFVITEAGERVLDLVRRHLKALTKIR